MAEQHYLVRFFLPEEGTRIGIRRGDTVQDVTAALSSMETFLQTSVGRVQAAWQDLLDSSNNSTTYPVNLLDNAPAPASPHWLPPVDTQEVWAAGVTYFRSREARQEEAVDGGDLYARVYAAERPELFFKARGESVVGHLDQVGIRADSNWNVPEPELALVLNPALEVVGLTIGNDMSSRSIEGENALYLPQAKVYDASCALGSAVLPWQSIDWLQTTITLEIQRDDEIVFTGSIHTEQIHRTMHDLIRHLGRSTSFPHGAILLTGTGIVPPPDFTLAVNDVVSITIDHIGTLTNTVKEV